MPLTADTRRIYYTRQTGAPEPRPGPQARRIKHKTNRALAHAKRPAPQLIHSDPAQAADAHRLAALTQGIQRAFGLTAQQAPDERAAGRKLWRHRNKGKR